MKRIILLLITILAGIWIAKGQSNAEWATYLEGYEITEMAAAGDYLWLTDGKEVIKFDRNTAAAVFYNLEDVEKLPFYEITSIACSKDGLPWIAVTSVGILKLDENEKWIKLPIIDTQSDPADRIYITENDVVYTWRTTPTSLNTSVDSILSTMTFWETWFGYEGNRILTRYEGNQVDTFQLESRISSVAEDKDGNLWITEWALNSLFSKDPQNGFFSKDPHTSLVKYDGEKWTTYYWPEFYAGNPLMLDDITFDESGNIWMHGSFGLLGGRSKLIQFNQSDWQVFDLPVHEHGHRITSFALQDNGAIWMGTSEGFMKFKNSQWTTYDIGNDTTWIITSDTTVIQISPIYVSSIVVDHDGTKWMGTEKGLVAFNENVSIIPEEAAVSSDIVLGNSTDIHSDVMKEVELFPNPTWDFATLEIKGDILFSTVDILNILGQKIKSFNIDNQQNQLDVSHLLPGVYLVRINSRHSYILKKLIKQ